ncbi:MAG: HD domain-containing protein [Solirubrobacteraceae bacterium]
MSKVGTWAWSEATGGRLRRRDELELLRQAVLARIAMLPAPGRRQARSTGLLELPDPPDSALARAAEERVMMLSEPLLYAHCLRTWAFAALLAQRDGISHDPELLYLACVLHDLGLTTHHDGRDTTACCFAVEGARAAHVFLCSHQVPAERAVRVAEAISLHLNVTVSASLGAEAALLSRGAALDAVGRYAHRISRTDQLGVMLRWPRVGFADYLAQASVRQSQLRPRSRSRLFHRLGFAGMVAANPLDR